MTKNSASTPITNGYVLLSGGIDSSTCLAYAVKHHEPNHVLAFAVDYGQRHSRELKAAAEVAAFFGVPLQLLQLGPQPKSALTDASRELPKLSYAELPAGMSPSYHYFRNGQFLSTAAAFACANLDYTGIKEGTLYAGMHAEDAANWAYADCTPAFVEAMAEAINIGTYEKLHFKAPLVHLTKAEVIKWGMELHPQMLEAYALSYSCYNGGEIHCGLCSTCQARKQAFIDAGVEDPTIYAS